MSGKGSRPRPFSVTQEEYMNRWDAIFGRDLDKKENTDQQRFDKQVVMKEEFYDLDDLEDPNRVGN
jgi:hypothetical protein